MMNKTIDPTQPSLYFSSYSKRKYNGTVQYSLYFTCCVVIKMKISRLHLEVAVNSGQKSVQVIFRKI